MCLVLAETKDIDERRDDQDPTAYSKNSGGEAGGESDGDNINKFTIGHGGFIK